MKLWLCLALPLALSFAMLLPTAQADSSVVVLGVRSLDGDDEVARRVSAALREAAKGVADWRVSDRDVSLAQMSLAHGCEEPDARCMADVANTLSVDRLIYGTMVHSGSQVQLALFNFDAVTGQVETSTEHKTTSEQLTGNNLPGTARWLMDRLIGKQPVGALRVLCDSPFAEVAIDGSPSGTLNARGELLVAELAAGKHVVSVRDLENDRSKDVPVMVGENAMATLRVILKPRAAEPDFEAPAPSAAERTEVEPPTREKSSLRRILGWTAVSLGAGLAGATIYSWVRLVRIADDPNLNEYRAQFAKPEDGGSEDVCIDAKNRRLAGTSKAELESSARSLCEEADALQVLQYVFLGGALAFGGVGTYLLWTDAKQGKSKLTVRPSFGLGQAQMRASYQF